MMYCTCIAVNNVGRFYDYPEYLADVDEMVSQASCCGNFVKAHFPLNIFHSAYGM